MNGLGLSPGKRDIDDSDLFVLQQDLVIPGSLAFGIPLSFGLLESKTSPTRFCLFGSVQYLVSDCRWFYRSLRRQTQVNENSQMISRDCIEVLLDTDVLAAGRVGLGRESSS